MLHFIVFDKNFIPSDLKEPFNKFLKTHSKHLDLYKCQDFRCGNIEYSDKVTTLAAVHQRFTRINDHLIAFWFKEGDILDEFKIQNLDTCSLVNKGVLNEKIIYKMNKWASPIKNKKSNPFRDITISQPNISLFQLAIVEYSYIEPI